MFDNAIQCLSDSTVNKKLKGYNIIFRFKRKLPKFKLAHPKAFLACKKRESFLSFFYLE